MIFTKTFSAAMSAFTMNHSFITFQSRNVSTLVRRTGPGFNTRLMRSAIFDEGIRKGPNRLRWEDGTCLYVKKCGFVRKECLEAIRLTLVRHLRQYKSDWEIFVYPKCNKPITRKPLNVRMGKGKSPIKFFVASMQVDDPFIEIRGLRMDVIEECIHMIKLRSPLPLYSKGIVEKSH